MLFKSFFWSNGTGEIVVTYTTFTQSSFKLSIDGTRAFNRISTNSEFHHSLTRYNTLPLTPLNTTTISIYSNLQLICDSDVITGVLFAFSSSILLPEHESNPSPYPFRGPRCNYIWSIPDNAQIKIRTNKN
jgi:hypothetical protein